MPEEISGESPGKSENTNALPLIDEEKDERKENM